MIAVLTPEDIVAAKAELHRLDALVPEKFLRLSAAANILESRMWGGIPRPEAVSDLKQKLGDKLSVGCGRWRERARRRLRRAATEGEISVFVLAPGADPVAVPVTVLRRLIPSRGGLPDHPTPLSLSAVIAGGGDERLYALLKTGILITSDEEFNAWCRTERRRRRWPSQWSISKRPGGRPTKRTDCLKYAVQARVNAGQWHGGMGIPALWRALAGAGWDISEDTLARAVDDMFDEHGDSRLRRTKRRAKRAKAAHLPQNYISPASA